MCQRQRKITDLADNTTKTKAYKSQWNPYNAFVFKKKFPQSFSLMYVNRSVYCGSEHKNNKMNEEALPSRTAGILEGHGFVSRWGNSEIHFSE